MFTLKRELRTAVVKTDFLPRAIYMTVHAFLTQLTFMSVVLLVAGVAAGRRLAVLKIRRVTVLTLDLRVGVGTGQRIVRQLVVKGFRVQRCYVHVAPLMLRVAGLTLLLLDTAMVAATFDDIVGHVLVIMTVQTKLSLG